MFLCQSLDEKLYNSWVLAIEIPIYQLFHTYHVVESWKDQLKKEINDKLRRDEIYKQLRCLLEELV